MAYSDFTLSEVKDKFLLSLNEKSNLFDDVKEIDYSEHLKETLKYNTPLGVSINTEKARSELIVAPVLVEIVKKLEHQISLFSGSELNVDKSKGLNGVCDFIISLSTEQFFLNAPIIAIVEAKNDNINSGLGQCISEMLSSKLFNEQKANSIKNTYGVVTTGSLWKFMKLSGNIVWIDLDEYHISNVSKIIAIFVSIIDSYKKE